MKSDTEKLTEQINAKMQAGQSIDREEWTLTARAGMIPEAPLYIAPTKEIAITLNTHGAPAIDCPNVEWLTDSLKLDTGEPLPPSLFIIQEGKSRRAEGIKAALETARKGGAYIPTLVITPTDKPLDKLTPGELTAWLRMNADNIDQEREEYQHSFGADLIDQDNEKWSEGGVDPLPTGFDSLDQILDGGLYPEALYSIGALSSLGKTTFVLQIADHIAASGRDVLYVALEQSASELRAKSLSRLTDTINHKYGRLSVTQIMNAQKRAGWYSPDPTRQTEQGRTYAAAINEYKRSIGQHMRIIEGVGNITVDRIRGDVEKNIRFRGQSPVVIIDYAQILAPAAEKLTDKQNVDRNIVELKRLARDKHTPVIAICSFNRDNYFAPVDKNAFKESGSIEYSADVLIGIQPKGMIQKSKDADGATNKDTVKACIASTIRNLEAVVLKNRNGEAGTVMFEYFTPCNRYTDLGIKPKDNPTRGGKF